MKSNTQELAAAIVTALAANNVEPEAEHTAAPGRDWGYVAAWPINDSGDYAVKFGDNGQTNYDIVDDIDDLACWLIGDDADLVQIANARDEDPKTVADDFDGECRVIIARYYNGPTRQYAFAMEETGNPEPLEFESAATAKEFIDAEESEIYHLSHNESGRPDFFIVAA